MRKAKDEKKLPEALVLSPHEIIGVGLEKKERRSCRKKYCGKLVEAIRECGGRAVCFAEGRDYQVVTDATGGQISQAFKKASPNTIWNAWQGFGHERRLLVKEEGV